LIPGITTNGDLHRGGIRGGYDGNANVHLCHPGQAYSRARIDNLGRRAANRDGNRQHQLRQGRDGKDAVGCRRHGHAGACQEQGNYRTRGRGMIGSVQCAVFIDGGGLRAGENKDARHCGAGADRNASRRALILNGEEDIAGAVNGKGFRIVEDGSESRRWGMTTGRRRRRESSMRSS